MPTIPNPLRSASTACLPGISVKGKFYRRMTNRHPGLVDAEPGWHNRRMHKGYDRWANRPCGGGSVFSPGGGLERRTATGLGVRGPAVLHAWRFHSAEDAVSPATALFVAACRIVPACPTPGADERIFTRWRRAEIPALRALWPSVALPAQPLPGMRNGWQGPSNP